MSKLSQAVTPPVAAFVVALLVGAVLLLACGNVFVLARSWLVPAPQVTVSSQGPTITQLEKLGQLVTLRVHVSDVLTASGEGYRGAWLIKGDALIAVDLTRARIPADEKDIAARHARVILPAPTVVQSSVDHERTKTWDVQKTTWIPFAGDPDRMRDEAMLAAQRLVDHAANSAESIDSGRELAEKLIKNLYRMVDWDVDITWEDRL